MYQHVNNTLQEKKSSEIIQNNDARDSTQQKLVKNLYRGILHREPSHSDLMHWESQLNAGLSIDDFVALFLETTEFKNIQKKIGNLFVEPGHFYSPIVNTAEISESFTQRQLTSPNAIQISQKDHLKIWGELLPYLKSIPFPEEKSPHYCYYFNNSAFAYGDGSIYYAMLRRFQPKRLIEVGAGYSSACALDTINNYLGNHVEVSFIEPYPELLIRLLGEQNNQRIKIYDSSLQKTNKNVFDSLENGDFLFIDSTHVMKTGSDVCEILFNILPALKPGVFIHFHDIFWPFEYKRDWVLEENRSWNEIYGLRAFLMNNNAYEIIFMNDYFTTYCQEKIKEDYPMMLKNTGGSIWLRKSQ